MKAIFDPKRLISITTISIAILFFVTYIVSIINNNNTLCNPFISGCSDITHAGFISYENYILKSILIPTATLMGVIFFFIKQFVIKISDNSQIVIIQGNIILFLAIIGCIGLVIGTSVIDGPKTPMRLHSKSIAIFFTLITLCQSWYTAIEYKYTDKINKLSVLLRRLAILTTAIIIAISILMPQTHQNHSIIEWWSVYAIIFWFWTFSITNKI